MCNFLEKINVSHTTYECNLINVISINEYDWAILQRSEKKKLSKNINVQVHFLGLDASCVCAMASLTHEILVGSYECVVSV